MPTLRDVAILAGVSTATVSHVVNNSRRTSPETRERVQKAIAQIGFVPNPVGRLLALRKNGLEMEAAEINNLLLDGSDESEGSEIREIGSVARDAGFPLGISSDTTLALLKNIRAAQPISRADLAKRLGVNRTTVTEIVKPLIASGVLRESTENFQHETSRSSTGLSLVAEKEIFIGVNIGVSRTHVGSATVDGQLLCEEFFDTEEDPNLVLARVKTAIQKLRANSPDKHLAMIVVCVPSPTDAERKRLLYAPHLGWRDVAVADALTIREKNGSVVPVIVENDSTAAATFEVCRRVGNSPDGTTDDFVLLRVGTGIGVGLVVGGEVYRGTGVGGGFAGEFGHMTIVAGGKMCVCGNRGCWESYASSSSAVALYTGDRPQVGQKALTFFDIVLRAEAGELRAQRTLERVGEYLGIGISNVIGGLGLPNVVVGGRIVHAWKFIEQPLREALERTMAGRLTQWSVEAGDASGAGLGGAIEVAIDEYLTKLSEKVRAAA
jgi:predicted NBD/HSP70 family sugar kinase/plasmid maintenance system antidote protein VapI